MQWLELHDVGFGECAVLGGKHREILMVDCGSLNRRLAGGMLFSDYAASLTDRYGEAGERSFLLTHFHKDHYGGLPAILRRSPHFFDRIYLPCSPVDEDGRPLLMELTILIDAFVTGPGTETVRMNSAALRFFQKLCDLSGTEQIFTLEAGDELLFDRETYQILWPPKEAYPFSPELKGFVTEADEILSRCTDSCAGAFLELKQSLCRAYLDCMEAFAYRTEAVEADRLHAVPELGRLTGELNLLLPRLHVLSAGRKVRELLCDRKTVMAVSSEINGSSMILSSERVLLTGDATPETMGRLRSCLREEYEIVKAPHHGTASAWWQGFAEMGIAHLLISNGCASAGGKISPEYASLNAMHHCTGSDHCETFEETGVCCNQTLYCPVSTAQNGLPLRCRRNECGIYLTGENGERHPCDCEKET